MNATQKQTINNPYRDYRKEYLRLGLIPLPAKGKNPIPKWGNFKEEPPCSDEYLAWEEEYPNANIWVLLNGKLVVDPECPEAEGFVKSLNLPRSPLSLSGNRSTHRWFENGGSFKPLEIIQDGRAWLEVRTGKQGMIVPPSIHPDTGKPYEWVKDFGCWDLDFPEFPIDAYQKIIKMKSKIEDKSMSANITPDQNNNPLPVFDSTVDIEAYLNFHHFPFKVKQEPDRILYLLQHCCWENHHTDKNKPFHDAAIIQGIHGKLGYLCQHKVVLIKGGKMHGNQFQEISR